MAQQDAPIVIEFFHDALSAWCYKASERLRALVAADPQVRVIQRCFPLATEPAFFSRLFPNKQEAKQEVVMVHWADARDFEPDPRIDCEAMMQADFDYPYSLPNLLGAKAAEMQGGQAAHWDFFDRVQRAHLSEARNIADWQVLRQCAVDVGLDAERWEADRQTEHAWRLLEMDVEQAARYRVLRIPALVADSGFHCPGLQKSTLGHCIREEVMQCFVEDLRRRRALGYSLPSRPE